MSTTGSSVKKKKKNPLVKRLKGTKEKQTIEQKVMATPEAVLKKTTARDKIEKWDRLPIEKQVSLLFSSLPLADENGETVPNRSHNTTFDAIVPKLDKNLGGPK